MANKTQTRVELNRRELDRLAIAEADGLVDLARDVLEDAAANAPDATPYGVGLVTGAGLVGYANGRQIASWAERGSADTPRALKGTTRGEIAVAGGFRFPARLQELGTIRHGAQPFLSPALSRKVPRASEYIADEIRRQRIGKP